MDISTSTIGTIGIIGIGNMGTALVRGLVKSGKAPAENIIVFDVDSDRTRAVGNELGVRTAETLQDAVRGSSDAVVFAVKPQILGAVLDEARPALSKDTLVMSIAAGVTTRFFEDRLGSHIRVIRAMPNAAATIGQAATAVCAGSAATDEDLTFALDLFGAFGIAARTEEKLMNAVTGLSGSGPAYLFIIMESMIDGAVNMGMDRTTAHRLAVQTIRGAAAMADEATASFSELKARITSPGGTTIAGVHALERGGIRGIMMDAVEAATRRGDTLASKE